MRLFLLMALILFTMSFSKKEEIYWNCHTIIIQTSGRESCYVSLVKADDKKEASKLFFKWVWGDINNKKGKVVKNATSYQRILLKNIIKENYKFKSWVGN